MTTKRKVALVAVGVVAAFVAVVIKVCADVKRDLDIEWGEIAASRERLRHQNDA